MEKHPVIFTYINNEISISFPDIPKERLIAKSQEEARIKSREYLNNFFKFNVEEDSISLSDIRLSPNQSINFL